MAHSLSDKVWVLFFTPIAAKHRTGGVLSDRIDEVQSEIDDWEQKISDNEEKLEKYEASLRTKYGNLDSLMSGYNTSLSYISSILSGSK